MEGWTYKYDGTYLTIYDDGTFYVISKKDYHQLWGTDYNSPEVQNNPYEWHLPKNPPHPFDKKI